MAYKCLDCGHVFDNGEQEILYETHGLDCPPYERFSVCPVCGGYFEETVKCKACGEEHLKKELNNWLCEECAQDYIDVYRYDAKECYKISQGEDEKIQINCFLASVFSKSEIETILYRELISKNAIAPIDCIEFIRGDLDWFFDKITEGVKK